MSKEFVFWFMLIKRSAFYFDSVWNFQKKLRKVVVTESQIWSDSAIEQKGGQGSLAIDLQSIDHISWSVTSPGTIGSIAITTQDLEHYYLTPANPLDPTMVHVHGNVDEMIAFCDVVNTLKANQSPNYDENPYARQFKKEDKPVYLRNMKDVHWDKNISPWEYYHEFVPASEDKKRRVMVMIYKFVVLSVLIVAILGFLYALIFNFKW